MSRFPSFLSILAGLAILLPTSATNGAGEAPPDENTALFLLKGMEDNLGRLHSGSFEAEGTIVVHRGTKKTYECNTNIYSSFDFRKSLHRFDEIQTIVYPKVFVVDESIQPKPPKGWEGKGSFQPSMARVRGGKFARDGKYSFLQINGSGFAVIDTNMARPPDFIENFDVRALPLAYTMDLIRNTPYSKLFETWTKAVSYQVTRERDGDYRLEHLGPYHREAIWIDADEGFGITRMDLSYRRKDAGGDRPAWEEPWLEKRITWSRNGGVWVPSSFRHIDIRPSKADEKEKITRKLSFIWKSVNVDTNVNEYRLERFNLPNGTKVLNRSLGPNVVERIVGISPEPDLIEPRGDGGRPTEERRRGLVLLIALNVLAIVAMFAYSYWTRKHK